MNAGYEYGEDGQRKMVLGLDYDDTYTCDPEFWNMVVSLAKSRGHKVHVVSCRFETMENRREMDVPGCLTYLTGMSPKRWFMEQQGIQITNWIDDVPESVTMGR